jgi:hypothetical protein
LSIRDVGGSGWDLVAPFRVVPELTGDYNYDGTVNAADYTVWRNNLGAGSLVNRDRNVTGPVGHVDYQAWKMHYGESLADMPSGSGEGAAPFQAVPEPPAGALLAVGLVWCLARARPCSPKPDKATVHME